MKAHGHGLWTLDDLGNKLLLYIISFDLKCMNGGYLIGTWKPGFWLGIQAQTVWILELPYLGIPKIFMCWSTVIRHDRNHNLSETRGANMCNQKLKTYKMYLNKQPPNTQTKPWNHVVNPNQKFPIWNGFYNHLLLKFTTYHIVLQFWKTNAQKKNMPFLIFLAQSLRACAEMKGRPFMKKMRRKLAQT